MLISKRIITFKINFLGFVDNNSITLLQLHKVSLYMTGILREND